MEPCRIVCITHWFCCYTRAHETKHCRPFAWLSIMRICLTRNPARYIRRLGGRENICVHVHVHIYGSIISTSNNSKHLVWLVTLDTYSVFIRDSSPRERSPYPYIVSVYYSLCLYIQLTWRVFVILFPS